MAGEQARDAVIVRLIAQKRAWSSPIFSPAMHLSWRDALLSLRTSMAKRDTCSRLQGVLGPQGA